MKIQADAFLGLRYKGWLLIAWKVFKGFLETNVQRVKQKSPLGRNLARNLFCHYIK